MNWDQDFCDLLTPFPWRNQLSEHLRIIRGSFGDKKWFLTSQIRGIDPGVL